MTLLSQVLFHLRSSPLDIGALSRFFFPLCFTHFTFVMLINGVCYASVRVVAILSIDTLLDQQYLFQQTNQFCVLEHK